MKTKILLLMVLSVASLGYKAQADIATGLVGHWAFDDLSGQVAADSTTNANDGTLINFPADDSQWVPGQIGGGLHFRGVESAPQDYVSVPDYPKGTAGTMSATCWVWFEGFVGAQNWVLLLGNWPQTVLGSRQFHLGIRGGNLGLNNFIETTPDEGQSFDETTTVSEGTPFPVASWQHVAFVVDGTFMRLYRNGEEVASVALSAAMVIPPPNSAFEIGARFEVLSATFKGTMDDVGLWDRDLSLDEIRAIYEAGLSGRDLSNVSTTPTPPTVVTQPQSTSRYAGESFSLSVQASGSFPLSYQWSKDSQPLPGATNRTLALSHVTTNSAGRYTVVVTNAFGTITSAPAEVTVQPVIDISTGLVGHWTLDETSGSAAADSTPSADNGALANFPTDDSQWVQGQIGGALLFGGVDVQDYVMVPDYPKPTNGTMTLSAWVWNDVQEGLTFPVTPQFVASWGSTSAKQQFRLGLQNNQLNASIAAGAMITARETATFPNQAWQHVAMVADGADLRVYRNGIEVATAAYNRPLSALSGPLILSLGNLLDDAGAAPIAIPDALFGKLDDVGLWVRALNANEILAIFSAGLSGTNLAAAVVGEAVAPTISSPPQGPTAPIFSGEKFSLSVLASGTAPLTYQWSKDGQTVPDATNKTLTISQASTNDSGSYTVVVSNSAGSVTSSAAVVSVTAIVDLTTGLAGHWKFDDASGLSLADSTTNANHGTLGNFPADNSQWVSGRIGGALHFRGPTALDYVVVPDYPKSASRMAISIWLWTDVRPTDWAMVINDWSGSCGQFHVGLFGGVDMANFASTGDCAALHNTREGVAFPVGSWEHVAFVYDGTMMRQYHNGAQVSAIAYDGTLYQPTVNSFGIGMKPNADGSGPGAFFWEGKMDDLGIWRRALSPEEVIAIYNAGLAGNDFEKAVVPTGVAPAFAVQPQSRSVFAGDTVLLSISVSGTQPLTYQWSKNGQPIAGATQDSLKLSNLSAADAGSYTLTVSNAVGSATSLPATVTVENVAGITAGLVGHWTFDNTTGLTLTDSTTNANHGTLGNFPEDNSQWVPGQIGGSLHFRGPTAQDYVLVPDYPKPASTMAISIWAWIDSQQTDWAFIMADWVGSCGQFHLALQAGVDISNFASTGNCGASPNTREGAAFPVASWQHVAFVADGSMMRLYRNGAQVSAAAYDGTLFVPTVKSFGLGMRPSDDGSGPGSTEWMWTGKLDDLGIWKRGLSPEEVIAIYNAGLAGKDLTTASAVESKSILWVSSGEPPPNADPGLIGLLQAQGYTVANFNSTGSTAESFRTAAAGKDLVIISETIGSTAVVDPPGDGNGVFTLKDTDIPVIAFEAFMFDNADWTGKGAFVDLGNSGRAEAPAEIQDARDSLYIINAAHPIAGGLSGAVKTYEAPYSFTYGKPSADADVVASIQPDGSYPTIFVYERGDKLVDGSTAPNRRIGVFLGQTAVPNANTPLSYESLTQAGRTLFLNTVAYALAPGRLTLSIARGTGDTVVITWSGNATLESAPEITGPWSTVSQASPYTLTPVSGAHQFFRLKL